MIRSSRLAELQSAVALDSAEPRTGDSIAGTLIEVIAAASESTTKAFWDRVFCRMLMISTTSVNSTAKALTIWASATITCRFISAGYAKRHRRSCLLLLPFTFDFVQRFFCAQAPTRSSAFSMFSIELATLKRK